MRVTTVVLGDLGRSPRMQYHAEALAAHEVDVDVIACAGSALHAELSAQPRITCHLLPPARERRRPRALLLPAAAARVAAQALRLVWLFLVVVRKPDVILVQNPPAVPALLVALVAARLRRARLVIDWHNLGWAVLALGVGARHPIVAAARWYEGALGRRADAHLCVSEALRADLAARFGIERVAVLRDRPAARFAPLPPAARRAARRWLLEALGLAGREPAIVVSPTSWTRDEDFDLLLEAVRRLETLAADRPFPEVVVLLTGRGALRERFEAGARGLPGRRVHVRTLWLEPGDYPRALAAADLGLCLHRSASGLDLPMKLADLQGAGLPVCALDYGPCLDEVLRHDDTGLRFADAEALARQWLELLAGFPERTPWLDRLRAGVNEARGASWRDGWEAEAREVLLAHA
ncbi:MAG TPA: glycosyltransferase [Methylomirabilota bacterium]|nr:glycosyltransferase [Methylomirabilota bacterium]